MSPTSVTLATSAWTAGGDPRRLLAAAARDLYRRGWMSGTAGNLSLRLDDGSFWITASGRSKGALGRGDFLRLAADGEVLERGAAGDRPSAEASLHTAVYRLMPRAAACFHVHTVASNVVTRLTGRPPRPAPSAPSGPSALEAPAGPSAPSTATAAADLPLPPLEMLKGLGIWDERPAVTVAVFPNHARVPAIAAELSERFTAAPPAVPGFLIRDHGLTVWGDSAQAALNHLELFDFIFQWMVAAHGAGLWPEAAGTPPEPYEPPS